MTERKVEDMTKSEYGNEELLQERKSNSVPICEQELHIYWMRDETTAQIYTSDTTQMTRLDKLCNEKDSMYELIEETKYGKRYLCHDKTLISFRRRKRELSDEQKEAASERMRQYQANKKS